MASRSGAPRRAWRRRARAASTASLSEASPARGKTSIGRSAKWRPARAPPKMGPRVSKRLASKAARRGRHRARTSASPRLPTSTTTSSVGPLCSALLAITAR
jgi:hypothetical protein